MSSAEHDAKLVHEAVAGLGTDERALAEVLCTISDRAMLALHEAYPRVYQKSLVDDVKGGVLDMNRVIEARQLEIACSVRWAYIGKCQGLRCPDGRER